jgi:hypothetical protein
MKVCNQTFIKDQFRNRAFIGTLKCIKCEEESNISLRFPCAVSDFNKEIQAFQKFHTNKGCNKGKLPAPEWAAQSVDFGIAVD